MTDEVAFDLIYRFKEMIPDDAEVQSVKFSQK